MIIDNTEIFKGKGHAIAKVAGLYIFRSNKKKLKICIKISEINQTYS
jgi:hypothetical protein